MTILELASFLYKNEMFLGIVDDDHCHIMKVEDECLTNRTLLSFNVDENSNGWTLYESLIYELEDLFNRDGFETLGEQEVGRLFKDKVSNYNEGLFL